MRRTVAFYDAYAGFEGSGRALLDIVDRLDPDRFDPVIVCPRDGGLVSVATERGHRVAILSPPRRLLQYDQALLSESWVSLPQIGVALWSHAATLRAWLRANDVSLLHCNQTRAVLQAGLGGKLARVPVVWGVRIQQPLPRLAQRLAAWCSDAVVPIALSCLDGLYDGDSLRRKVTEIPLGVDPERFGPAPERSSRPADLPVGEGCPLILMVGCLHPRKRHDILLEAMPAIAREVPQVRAVFAGGPPEDMGDGYLRTLMDRHANLGLGDRVVFAGRREDVPDLLRRCDVFVLPSDQEGLPAAVLEAMATAKPCVVTPPAAAPVEPGETGLIVAQNDPRALAAAVVRLLNDGEMASRLGRAARQRVVDQYSVDATVTQYAELYDRLLAAV